MKLTKDHKGYSLIELIIVIAICTVIATMAAFSTTIVTKARQRKVIRSVYTAVGQTRVSTMSKDDIILKLWKDSDGTFVCTYANGVEMERKKIAPSNITVYYTDSPDEAATPGKELGTDGGTSESAALKCEFNRASGVVKDSDFYKVKSGDYTMRLIKYTGKCTWN